MALRTRFVLVFAVIAVLLGVVLGITFARWQSSRAQLIRASTAELAQSAAESSASLLQDSLRVLQQAAGEMARPSWADTDRRAYLNRLLALYPQFTGFYLVLPDRVIEAGAPVLDRVAIRQRHVLRLLGPRQGGAVAFSAFPRPRLELAESVSVPGGGVLLGDMLPDRLSTVFPRSFAIPIGQYVLSSRGEIIFSKPDGGPDPSTLLAHLSGQARAAQSAGSTGSAGQIQTLHDAALRRPVIAAVYPIVGTQWTAVAIADPSSGIAPLMSQERMDWEVYGGVFVLTLLLVWWQSSDLVRSIQRLRRAAQAVAGGDIRYRVRFKTGTEVDWLVEAFNNMAERLEAHQDLLHDRNQQLNVLLRVVEGLRTERDPQDLLRRITQDAAFLTGASLAFLALGREDQVELKELWDGARWQPWEMIWKRGHGAAGRVYLHHDTLTSESYFPDQHLEDPIIDQLKLKSYVCAPIVLPTGSVSGVLFVGNKDDGERFTDDDVRIMELLARHAGVALEVEEAFQREHRIAATLQKAMLPDVDPGFRGLEIARKYQAATEETELGGDFYDVIELPNGLIGLVIADVSGKGLKAAVQTAAVKYALRAYALEDPEPGSVLGRLNDCCNATTSARGFITLFYAVLDLQNREIRYANAGHQPALLRPASGAVESLESEGVVLGVVESRLVNFRQVAVPLRTGDTLVLYTDGLSEARSGDDFLDTEGLQALLGQIDLGAQETASLLLSSATAFADGHLRDDVALLVVKITEDARRTSGGPLTARPLQAKK